MLDKPNSRFRIKYLLFLSSVLQILLSTPSFSTAAVQKVEKPNIVFLLVDDMGYGDLSCYGAPDVKTPILDRLAKQGAKLTSYYAAGAECTPSRTAFITGRYPQRPGGLDCAIGTGNVGRYDDAIRLAEKHDLGLPVSHAVIGSAMKRAGYATAVLGKWHLGYESKFNPLNYGFDRFFGFLGGNVDYFTHTELSDLPVFYSGLKPIEQKGYMTHLIDQESVRFIHENKDSPFFLYVPYGAPHFPFQGPNDNTGKMHPKETWTKGTRAKYVEMLEDMDASVGRILNALDETKLTEKTIVVFASDHGAMVPGRNLPFRGFKGGLFEGGIRTTCLARWPGHIEPGIVSNQSAITMDLTVSFLRIAGAQSPKNHPLDGIDIIQHLEEKRPDFQRTLFWRARRGDRTWKAIRDQSMKYIWKTEEGKIEEWLFDLSTDKSEKNNLLDEKSKITKQLKEKIAQWEKRVQHSR